MVRTAVRRLVKAAVVGGLAALVAVWFRSREPDATDPESAPASWPPLAPDPAPAPPRNEAADEPSPIVVEPSDGAAAPAPEGDWVGPDDEGGCPISHPIKVKLRSGIYHTPQGASYERTNADRCYPSPAAAEADGYRASKT